MTTKLGSVEKAKECLIAVCGFDPSKIDSKTGNAK